MHQPESVDRATRIAAAEAVCRHVLSCYGEDVLGVAIYGSVARGDDGPHSDVELMVVTTPAISPPNTWVFENGVLLDVSFVSEERLMANAGKVGSWWPIEADGYRLFRVLFEREPIFERVRRASESASEEAFLSAMRFSLAEAFEALGKLRNAWWRGQRDNVLAEARWFALVSTMFVGLANRQHYPTGRYIWSMAVQFPQRPRDYAALLPVVAGFRTLDPAEVYQAAETLWQRLETFAEERGVRLGDLTIEYAIRSTQ